MTLPMSVKTDTDATLRLHFNDLRYGAFMETLKKPRPSGFYFFHKERTISYAIGNIEVLT